MSSQTAKFTFPETLGGKRQTSSPKSSGSKQTQSTERCIYVVQEYNCPHHPSLNTPHIFHRIPCPQALLPHTSQTDCENYAHHKDELVQVSRYVLDRGCMECKTLARARRHEEAATHPEIRRKMQELGLGQEDIDHFEKVTSSFPASRRVLELVRAREKSERLRREEVPEEWRRKDGEDEVQNQGEAKQGYELQSKIDNAKGVPPATLVSSIEGPVVEQSDSAEKEHEITQLQPIATKVKNPQRAKILSKRDTSQPSARPTKLRSLTASIATRVLQRDELMQPQSQVPTHKESTPHPSSKPTKLNDPTSDTPPEEEVQIAELPERYLEAPTTEASFTIPGPKSYELQATPPTPSPSPKEESPPPEKLTDNIHLSLDEEWDTDEESERVFGEVALAPSFGCQTGDEWIVVGSWEQ